MASALDTVSEIQIIKAVELIRFTILNGNMIYVCGNGGSAAIANMLSAIWMKWVGERTSDHFRAKVISLSCNSPLMTAISNDIGYENVYSFQLDSLLEPGDLVITVSSSGNSPNIRKVIELCKNLDNPCIAFSGFNGGISQLADIQIHIDSHEYCLVEDSHQAIAHHICRRLIYIENQTTRSNKT